MSRAAAERVSCADYGWTVLSHPVVLALIADLGFAAVDIGVFAEATHVTVSSIRGNALRRADQLRPDLERTGLGVADVFLTSSGEIDRLTPTSRAPGDQEELRSIFTDTCRLAIALGAPGVTLLPGVVAPGQPLGEAIAAAADGLAALVEIGGTYGLPVSVEPHVGSCIETPAATGELLAACPGLMVTLDPSHFAYQGVGVADMLALAERTRHVQIRPAGPGAMQVKVPDDQVDLPGLISGLLARGYQGWFASEYVWMSKWRCDEVDNTAESARLRTRIVELIEAGAP